MNTVETYASENYESRRVSNFLDWAHRRLTQEIQEIEEMEKEHGNANWKKEENPNLGRPARTMDQKVEVFNAVNALREKGQSIRSSCKEMGLSPDTYYNISKELNLPFWKPAS